MSNGYDGEKDRRANCIERERRCREEMKRIDKESQHRDEDIEKDIDSIVHPTDGALAELHGKINKKSEDATRCIAAKVKDKIGLKIFLWIMVGCFAFAAGSYGFSVGVYKFNDSKIEANEEKIRELENKIVTKDDLNNMQKAIIGAIKGEDIDSDNSNDDE